VERLYESDTQAADRMLKELIVYLRAAIPQIRDPISSVAREIRLVNAYLNVIRLRSQDLLRVTDAGSEIASAARLPPMVLLPLINHALASRTQRANEESCFEVDVAVHDDRLRLAIRDQGAGFAVQGEPAGAIAHIRERLAILYGEDARLTMKDTGGGTEAVMEIPYERVPDALGILS
jgi:LytS/YehU family sensor histidine kinase